MYLLPRSTERHQVFAQTLRDPRNFRPRKSVIFTQLHRPSRAIQIEHRLTSSTNHMHMCGPMIIEIDGTRKPPNLKIVGMPHPTTIRSAWVMRALHCCVPMGLHSSRGRISLCVLLLSSVFAVLMFSPFSDDATSTVSLPAAGRGISPAFSRDALLQFKVEIPPIPA
jgi:hypothetical protein